MTKPKLPIQLLLSILFLTGSLAAADFTGKWSGSVIVKTPDGATNEQPAWMSLKQAGNVLTGAAGANPEHQAEIRDGKVDGDRAGFKVTIDETVANVQLRLEGESLTGDVMLETPDGKVTAALKLKRAQ